jgi:hypothetical protein
MTLAAPTVCEDAKSAYSLAVDDSLEKKKPSLSELQTAPDWHKKNRRDLIDGFGRFLVRK